MPDSATPHGVDRAGAAYWDRFWRRRRLTGLATRASYFHHRLIALLAAHAAPGATVLEVGCGGSVWLPALARRGAACWGVDYSRAGLQLLERTLRRQAVAATLVEGDVLDPALLGDRRFDLVYSVGLVEHFSPPDALLRRLAGLLAPGGALVTLVPNFTGLWGRLQRRLDRPVYDTHVIYTPAALDRAHAGAGLAAAEPARFFGGFAPLVVNAGRAMSRLPHPVALGLLASGWGAQQAVAWATHLLHVREDSASRSGYIAGVYRAGPGAWR
jgi:SAM-dependent methyltransferase